jgi:hypothetical protein
MKHMKSTMVRAGAAVVSAILMAIAIGAFLPTPMNPVQFRSLQEKIDSAVTNGMVFRDDEVDQYLATPNTPDPSYIAAILDWHAWLLAPFSFISVLLFRPRLVASIISASIAALVLNIFVGLNAAALLLIAFVCSTFAMHFLQRWRAANHGNAA